MYVEMTCSCGAHFQLDVDEDFQGWLLLNRFVEAHVKCGYVTPLASDTPEKIARYDLKFKSKSKQLNEED